MTAADETLFDLVVRCVPQWYFSAHGPNGYELHLEGNQRHFYSQRPLTPELKLLLEWVNGRLSVWKETLPKVPTPAAIARITEEIALWWLTARAKNVEWDRVLAYCEDLRLQTHENAAVTRNLILCPAKTGEGDLTDASLVKPFARLGGSGRTYFRVDGALRYLGYEEVDMDHVKDPGEYKFHPDFLHPIWSCIGMGEYSVHVTTRGDIVVMDSHGLLAASRRGRWYIYSVQTFKNFFVDTLGDYRVGCNIFDVVFDLSYKRHGALLIYDPAHVVLGNVANSASIIAPGTTSADAPRALLRDLVGGIAMRKNALKDRRKGLFLEITSIDGAVIFDDKNVLAFGAIVKPHPDASEHGARTTAARSAFLWGGTPIKCSADGDISVRFVSKGPDGSLAAAHTEFL